MLSRRSLAAGFFSALGAMGALGGPGPAGGGSAARAAEVDNPFNLTPGTDGDVTPVLSRPLYAQAGTLPPGAGPDAPAPPTSPARPQRPLMSLLDRAGVGDPLRAAGINAYGYFEGSYTYNFYDPPRVPGTSGRPNLGRLFDIDHNDFLVNQLELTVERQVKLSSERFDVGGRVDLLYGTDARFIHSNGFLDDDGYPDGPQYQFDIPQFYVDVAIPVGSGLRLRLGKFEFFKPLDPLLSVFYSRTFAYATQGTGSSLRGIPPRVAGFLPGAGAALPFTLFGGSAYYEFGDRLQVEAGVSRGWDQSFDDNNGAVDGFVRVTYLFAPEQGPGRGPELTAAAISGPEVGDDNGHYRTAVDVSLSYPITPELHLLVDGVYGIQSRPSSFQGLRFDGAPLVPETFVASGDAHWYGVSGTVVKKVNPSVNVAARVEWYRDEQGYTTLLPQSLYEITLGVTITPFPDSEWGRNLKVRPEIRYDYSDRPYFEGFARHDQLTVAVDAVYKF